jgi:opacity protein-like surface antigen
MNMNALKTILLATVVAMPLAVSAQAADLGPDDSSAVSDPTLTGLYLRGDIGWSFLDVNGADNDNSWVAGGGVGYQFNDFLRTDITGNFSGDYQVAPGADISTAAVLGNVYFDWANESMFTPYIGAGAGYGWVNGSGTATDDSGLALGAAAGVAIDITNNIALDAGYRYQNINVPGDNVQEHQATVGFRFKF